jgi:hypothetical protein
VKKKSNKKFGIYKKNLYIGKINYLTFKGEKAMIKKLQILIYSILLPVSLFSQELPVINPCLTDYQLYPCNVPWEGPKYMTICEGSFLFESIDCNLQPPQECCFQIEYYDRVIFCGVDTLYDVQLVLISYSDICSDCALKPR